MRHLKPVPSDSDTLKPFSNIPVVLRNGSELTRARDSAVSTDSGLGGEFPSQNDRDSSISQLGSEHLSPSSVVRRREEEEGEEEEEKEGEGEEEEEKEEGEEGKEGEEGGGGMCQREVNMC